MLYVMIKRYIINYGNRKCGWLILFEEVCKEFIKEMIFRLGFDLSIFRMEKGKVVF